MKSCRKFARDAHHQWPIARLQRKLSRAVRLQMPPEEAAQHLEKIALIIFWLSVVSPDGLSTKVAYIFRIDVKMLSRAIGAPTSPQLIADLTEGLHLLRDHAIALGCWGTPPSPKPVTPPSPKLVLPSSLACPGKDEDPEEELPLLAPGYLANNASSNAEHLQG